MTYDGVRFRIERKAIKGCPGVYRDRHFLEVQVSDGTWRDVSNHDFEHEARRFAERVVIVGNRWGIKEPKTGATT
jgi:hypothetical protein